MRRATTALLLAALGVTGCAHTAWVRAGDRHAMGGQWEEAIDDYTRAQEIAPGSKRIAGRLENAWERLEEQRREQIRAELAEAELALRQGDWVEVVMHVEKAVAIDPESEVAGEVAWEAAQELKALSASRLKTGAVLEAYSYALLGARLLPTDPSLSEAVSHARSAVLVEAIAKADAEEYEAAWELASAVRDSEAPEVSAGVVEAIAARWAASLHQEAQRDEARGRLGSALARYARASAIGGDDADRVARERIAARLVDTWRFEVTWSGSTSREALGLREAVERSLSEDPRVAFGGGSAYGIELTAVSKTCAQTAADVTGEHRYVSGTRRVANPAWATAQQDARYAEARRIGAEATALERADDVARAERAVEWWIVSDWTRASDDLRLAETELAAAQRTESAAEAALREASEILAAARLDPNWSGTPIAELEQVVYARSRTLEEAQGEREIAETAHWRAAHEYETADQELDRLQRVLTAARDTEARARDDMRRARTDALEAVARLDVTPAEIDEDVWSTFRYPMQDVTRTCEVTAKIGVRTASGVETTTLRQATSTTDRTHLAQPDFGIAADPLAFASNDESLVVTSLGALVPTLVATVESGRDAHYADLFARAGRTDDVNEATTLYAAGLLLDPDQAPSGAVAWLEDTWNTEIATLLGG